MSVSLSSSHPHLTDAVVLIFYLSFSFRIFILVYFNIFVSLSFHMCWNFPYIFRLSFNLKDISHSLFFLFLSQFFSSIHSLNNYLNISYLSNSHSPFNLFYPFSFVIYIYIYIYILVKLETIFESDQKTPFSIATIPRCRRGLYPFPFIATLYPWYVSYIAEC